MCVPMEKTFKPWRDGSYPYANMVVEVVSIVGEQIQLRAVERPDGDNVLWVGKVRCCWKYQ